MGQRVKSWNTQLFAQSQPLSVEYVVLQASVAGPELFLVTVNDLDDIVPFLDDTSIFACCKTPEDPWLNDWQTFSSENLRFSENSLYG